MVTARSVVVSVAAALLLACSGARPAPGPAPPAGARAAPSPASLNLLEPSAAALRTADRTELTGHELGTMWTFENPPLAYWRTRYGFDATPAWLEHVRLSSVRFGDFCSASFVSADGLAMTNQHCARECIEAVSTTGIDHLERGFYATTRAQERICPGLFLDQLVAIEDITDSIRQAVTGAPGGEAIGRRRNAAIERMETECAARTRLRCEVVALYHGGQFQLYQYRRYEPVKLVFAPELQAGYFGGDPDNFSYPRYSLDVSFVRAYDAAGRPASTPHHFSWRADGAREGELVFVIGNPAMTSRLTSLAQLMYERQYRHPFLIHGLEGQRSLLLDIAAAGADAEQQVRQDLFSIENSLEAYRGELEGLLDTLLVGRKVRWERELRERVRADPALQQRYGDVWDRLLRLEARKLDVSPRYNFVNLQMAASPHLLYAGQLVTYVSELARPEAERSAEFRGAVAEIEDVLRQPTPLDDSVAERLLALHLDIGRRWLDPGDSLLRTLIHAGETTAQAAARLARESRILDPAFRTTLLRARPEALDTVDDPLIRFAVRARDARPALSAEWAGLVAAEREQNARLGEALFAVYGRDQPPDATFTLRISEGVVAGYSYNGTIAPPITTFFGMYGRAAAFGNRPPWTLPERFDERRSAIRMGTPFTTVSTNDVAGGNSGSPLIDREARIVGVAFDGNREQLPNTFVFRSDAARTVSVHAAGILEALRSVYDATRLVQELTRTRDSDQDR
jgi:hypothetical protein